MNAEPKLALIGCGAFAEAELTPALQALGWTPTVFADPVHDNVSRLASLWRGAATQTAPDWSCAAAAFDAAVVAVPRPDHAAIGTALINAGKPVFFASPLDVDAGRASRLVALAESAGVVLAVGDRLQVSHVAGAITALLKAGAFGASPKLVARVGSTRANGRKGASAFLPDEGGVLADLGGDVLGLLTRWFGDPADLSYQDDSRGGVETECVLRCAFADGAQARVELSRLRRFGSTLHIEGDGLFLEADLDLDRIVRCSPSLDSVPAVGDAETAVASPTRSLSRSLDAFRRAVQEKVSAGDELQRHLQTVALIERCYKAREPLPDAWSAPGRATASLPPGVKVLVTGATGFIGGRLVEALTEQGAQVRCLVRDFAPAVRIARYPIDLRKADLADRAAVHDALTDVEIVFHCAYDWNPSCQNLDAADSLLAASLERGVRRFVHLSTFSIYQGLSEGAITETSEESQDSAGYAKTKLDIEAKVMEAARDGLSVAILQPTIVYGPFSKPWTIDQADMLKFGTLVMPDEGRGVCNALHIDDLVEAMLLAATRAEGAGERFLISGPEGATWGQFYEGIAKETGADGLRYWSPEEIAAHEKQGSGLVKKLAKAPRKVVAKLIRLPKVGAMLEAVLRSLPGLKSLSAPADPTPATRIPGRVHVPSPSFFASRSVVDISKARRLLGYQPKVSLEQGNASAGAFLRWSRSGEVDAASS